MAADTSPGAAVPDPETDPVPIATDSVLWRTRRRAEGPSCRGCDRALPCTGEDDVVAPARPLALASSQRTVIVIGGPKQRSHISVSRFVSSLWSGASPVVCPC